jgi:hypothetical protein
MLLCGVICPPAEVLAAAPVVPRSSSQPAAVNDDARLEQAKARFEILLAAGLYTRWPAGAFDRMQEGLGTLKVGIVGSDPHVEQLEALAAGRQIAGRQVVVRHYPDASEVEPCQILFLAGSLARSDRAALIEKYKDSPVLLVGNTPEFCREGGGLDFRMENGGLKFGLNPQALARQKLVVDPRFSRLARTANAPAPKNASPTAAKTQPVHQTVPPRLSPKPHSGPQDQRPHAGGNSSRSQSFPTLPRPPSGGKRP